PFAVAALRSRPLSPRWSHPRAHRCQSPLGAPSGAASPLCSRSWLRSSRSPPTASYARPGAHAPSEPLAHEPQGNISLMSSSLHPLKSWSLRESRVGSQGQFNWPLTTSRTRCTLIGLGGSATSTHAERYCATSPPPCAPNLAYNQNLPYAYSTLAR